MQKLAKSQKLHEKNLLAFDSKPKVVENAEELPSKQ